MAPSRGDSSLSPWPQQPETFTAPVSELLRLDGKVAVVTGAAKGIGRAIAGRLAGAGAAVAATDVDNVALDEMMHRLHAHSGTRVNY